jgi:pyrimidine deaminase RibD-like protein
MDTVSDLSSNKVLEDSLSLEASLMPPLSKNSQEIFFSYLDEQIQRLNSEDELTWRQSIEPLILALPWTIPKLVDAVKTGRVRLDRASSFADTLSLHGAVEESEKILRAVKERDPENSAHLNDLAVVLLKTGDKEKIKEAVDLLDKAVELDAQKLGDAARTEAAYRNRDIALSLLRTTDDDEKFMRLAIDQAKMSMPEDDRSHPKVEVVVAKGNKILAIAHRGELGKGEHAEYTVLERRLMGTDLTGTTLYTTLEPCTTRSHDKIPCAERIIVRRIGRVVIGMLDPNPSIQGKGMYKLDKAGVRVQLAELLTRGIKELNKDFIAAQEKQETTHVEQRATDPDYRHKFVEPLLQQVLQIIDQLKKNRTLEFLDYWTPDKIRTNPYFYIDSNLKAALEDFFQAYRECEGLTAAAYRAYEDNCKRITRFHMSDYVKKDPGDAFGRACQRVEQSLFQTSLITITDPNQLRSDERVGMSQHVKRAMVEALGDYAEMSENVKRTINEIINGLIKLNRESSDIRAYVDARKRVETTSELAHKFLWQKFVGSMADQPH